MVHTVITVLWMVYDSDFGWFRARFVARQEAVLDLTIRGTFKSSELHFEL